MAFLEDISVFWETLPNSRKESLLRNTEDKLELADFLGKFNAPYQKTLKYKAAIELLQNGGDPVFLLESKINELVNEFKVERWKIFYEFGTHCTTNFSISSHPFYYEVAVRFIACALGFLLAKDSPIYLNEEEKYMAIFILFIRIHKKSSEICDGAYHSLISAYLTLSSIPRD